MNDDKVVYTARPRPTPMTVGHLIAELSKMDKSLKVWVDTEARCDQAHMYAVEGAWVNPDPIDGGNQCTISLHIF